MQAGRLKYSITCFLFFNHVSDKASGIINWNSLKVDVIHSEFRWQILISVLSSCSFMMCASIAVCWLRLYCYCKCPSVLIFSGGEKRHCWEYSLDMSNLRSKCWNQDLCSIFCVADFDKHYTSRCLLVRTVFSHTLQDILRIVRGFV